MQNEKLGVGLKISKRGLLNCIPHKTNSIKKNQKKTNLYIELLSTSLLGTLYKYWTPFALTGSLIIYGTDSTRC